MPMSPEKFAASMLELSKTTNANIGVDMDASVKAYWKKVGEYIKEMVQQQTITASCDCEKKIVVVESIE